MDELFKSTMIAMDAAFGPRKLPPAPRVDGRTTVEDEPAALWLEYRVNADDYCELVTVCVNFGGADCEIPISAFSAKRLEEMEALCAQDWDEHSDTVYARAK